MDESACAASVAWPLLSLSPTSALTQLTQIPPWPQDTRTHHGITTVSSRILPDLCPGGGGSSWPANTAAAAFCRHIHAYPVQLPGETGALAAVWRQLKCS